MNAVWGALDLSLTPDSSWLERLILRAQPAGHLFGDSVVFDRASSVSGAASFHPAVPGHLTIAADVRLHNCGELYSRLGIERAVIPAFDDRHLLLAAYAKWGQECGRFLLGEFAFAIWDDRLRTLFCCRDHMGFRPFLWWQNGSRFAFAANLKTILSFPDVQHSLNPRKFAETVVHDGNNRYPEDTFHLGIMSLPPGSSLTVDGNGVHSQKYWEPEIRPDLVPARPEEAFEALRELLFEAVDCRLPPNVLVSAELSGGLDSSSITAIAARCLERQGRELVTLSAVVPPERQQQAADEREFIDEFRSWPNIRMQYITAPDSGPFDDIDKPERFLLKPTVNSRDYLHNAFDRALVSTGSPLLLQGHMGEMGPTCKGAFYLAELAGSLRWATLLRELWQFQRVNAHMPLGLLYSELRDFLPRRPPKEAEPYVLVTPPYAVLDKDFKPPRRQSGQRAVQIWALRRFLRNAVFVTGQTASGRARASQPLLDKRVVEYCLAAPPAMKVRNGYFRYLIRGSLGGVLPEKIRWRTDKKAFSPDYFIRYNAQLGKAREFVAEIGSRDPVRSVIDVDRLALLLKPVEPGTRSYVARVVVPTTIYSICFLRQFAEFRP